MKKQQIFKDYFKSQLSLPVELEVFIPDNHIVRIVDQVIDSIDISPLLEQYKGGGSSAYHPKMLLKVIIYAYTQRIYSGRVIAKELRENINFMWIAAKNIPDFRTINRFRSEKMKEQIQIIFANVVILLNERGFIKLDNCFVDGTKIEANANKYSFVWKGTKNYHAKNLKNKINSTLAQIDEAFLEEEKIYKNKDLHEVEGTPVTVEELENIVKSIDEKLSNNPKDKILKKAKKDITENFIPRLVKYKKQEEILGERNSYSKTDNDATFMRMKEDHMRNGQLKPGYNVQISTENQMIVNFSIHQKPGDTTTLIPHLNQMENLLGKLPKNIVADAGYGSEENYKFLEENNLGNYVKYNTWLKDLRNKKVGKYYSANNFIYYKEKDYYICPNGEFLYYKKTSHKKTETGYLQEIKEYQCNFCGDCTLREFCTTSKYGRTLGINKTLEDYKRIARMNLCSEEGTVLRKRRSIDVEPVFGMIKGNRYFKKFMLRGLPKVEIEWGLLSIAHNFKKLTSMMGIVANMT